MIRTLAALVLSALLIAAPALAAPMPWKTFSGAVDDVVNFGMSYCGGQGTPVEIFIVQLEKNGAGYLYFYEPESGRILWLYFPQAVDGARPTEYAVATVDLVTPGAHDVIPPLDWQPVKPGIGSACELLLPRTA